MAGRSFIGIIGHGPELEREDGAAMVLRGLGASVSTLDLWDEPHRLFRDDEEANVRALIVEALDRPDLAIAALRALRREPRLEAVGALVAVTAAQAARVDPAGGFDDFVLVPYVPAELYARIRLLEWRRSEFATEERMKVGAIVIDRAAREVLLGGASVVLTAKEFSLLAYLCERRGKVVSREELLRRVWGNRYEGGARTVDIHVRRLRAKLGPSLPLVTLRGSGYKLEAPERLAQDRAAPQGDAVRRPVLAISIGCPSGVGPEVSVAGAAASRGARCVLVGDEAVIQRAAKLRRVSPRRLVSISDARAAASLSAGQIGVWAASTRLPALPTYGAPDAAAGAAELAWIDEATDLVRAGVADALVTGPVSKLAIARSGAPGSAHFLGHTEHLAARLGAPEVVMAFASPELVTALVTTHLALGRVPEAITPEAVATSAYWLARLLVAIGKPSPRVAVAALNPHAGEGGLLGDEERTRIAPGIERARARLAADGIAAELVGPVGAETAFRLAARAGSSKKSLQNGFDGVVAMYHDQATIPSKLLGFGEAVNVTLALPIVRTSVDHGTAYDLAGTGRADARGMREAIALAVKLATGLGRQKG